MLKVIIVAILLASISCDPTPKPDDKPNKPVSIGEQIKVLIAQIPKLEELIKQNNIMKKTSEVVERITSTGYSKYVQSSEFQRLDQLDEEFYGDFLTDFLNGLGIFGKLLDSFKQALMTVLDTDGDWKVFKFIFSDKKDKVNDGGLGFILIIVQRIKSKKEINFISTKTTTQFKMFPDLVIIKKIVKLIVIILLDNC